MCGITGHFSIIKDDNIDIQCLNEATKAIQHRGPDDGGFSLFNKQTHHFIADDSPVKSIPNLSNANGNFFGGFGHRRLSIIDLSEAGHQPMSLDHFTITFNGEIYNYLELRKELLDLGYKFKTATDTEVLLTAYKHWGKACLEKIDGMFSFVIYDQAKKTLFGARDRIGVKPFYFIYNEKQFSFASEQQALHHFNNVDLKLNNGYLFDLFVFGEHERRRRSVYSIIQELKAGESFELDIQKNDLQIHSYFNIASYQIDESSGELENILLNSISKRMRADVKIGACLSGGIDSSILAGMMAKMSQKDIYSFTAHYPGTNIDEGKYAKDVVSKHQLKAFYTSPNAKELIGDYKEFIQSLDLPIWSTSTYSQWRVMKLAQQNGVKVVLDGQGADELFGGYTPHELAYWRELLNSLKILSLINELKLTHLSGTKGLIKDYFKLFHFDRLPKALIKRLLLKNRNDLKYINREWLNQNFESALNQKGRIIGNSLNDFLEQDLINGRLKTFLRCEDRCSMWHNIESRTPFADDVRLIQYAMSLSSKSKILKGNRKYLLKEAGKPYLPKSVYERKDKIGFATPHNKWTQALSEHLAIDFNKTGLDFMNNKALNADYSNFFSSKDTFENVHNFKYLAFVEWFTNHP